MSIPAQIDDLPCEYTKFPIIDGKKGNPKYIGQNKSIQYVTDIDMSTQNDVVARNVNLFDTDIGIIDIDEDIDYEQVIMKHQFLEDTAYTTLSGNTKGWHVAVKHPKLKRQNNKINGLHNFQGDIITKNVFERVDKQWINRSTIIEITDEQLDELMKPEKQKVALSDNYEPATPRF